MSEITTIMKHVAREMRDPIHTGKRPHIAVADILENVAEEIEKKEKDNGDE